MPNGEHVDENHMKVLSSKYISMLCGSTIATTTEHEDENHIKVLTLLSSKYISMLCGSTMATTTGLRVPRKQIRDLNLSPSFCGVETPTHTHTPPHIPTHTHSYYHPTPLPFWSLASHASHSLEYLTHWLGENVWQPWYLRSLSRRLWTLQT